MKRFTVTLDERDKVSVLQTEAFNQGAASGILKPVMSGEFEEVGPGSKVVFDADTSNQQVRNLLFIMDITGTKYEVGEPAVQV